MFLLAQVILLDLLALAISDAGVNVDNAHAVVEAVKLTTTSYLKRIKLVLNLDEYHTALRFSSISAYQRSIVDKAYTAVEVIEVAISSWLERVKPASSPVKTHTLAPISGAVDGPISVSTHKKESTTRVIKVKSGLGSDNWEVVHKATQGKKS